MLTYLPDYTALIQLLVGSVIVSSFFQKDFSDPLEKFRKDIKDSYYYPLLLNYEIIDSNSAKNNLRALRKSLMLVLSIYGCMILFYCASFPSEHTIPPISIYDKGETILLRNDLTAPLPSPLGIALLSLLVTIYQTHVIRKPSTRIQSNNFVFIGGIVLMFIVFIIYILFFPTKNLDLSYFIGDHWKKTWELRWIVAVNFWVLSNLVLWIGFHLRLHYASTKRHYNHLENRVKGSLYKLDIYSRTKSFIGIKDRFTFISKEIEKQNNRSLRKYLIQKAEQELKIESNYYTVEYDSKKSNVMVINYDKNLVKSLNSIIENNNKLTKRQKKRLAQSIIHKIDPSQHSTSDIPDIYQELDQLSKNFALELCNLGIIEKRP